MTEQGIFVFGADVFGCRILKMLFRKVRFGVGDS